MISHPEIRVMVLMQDKDQQSKIWQCLDNDIEHLTVHYQTDYTSSFSGYDAVVTLGTSLQKVDIQSLLDYVGSGGSWLVMTQKEQLQLPEFFGVQPGPLGPESELRILFEDSANPLGVRLPDAVYVSGWYHPLQITAANTETLLYTDWHYSHQPVWTICAHGAGQLSCTTLQDFSPATLRQLIYRLLRTWRGAAPNPATTLGIGILGYAPSVGLTHGLAAEHVPGLKLVAACDLSAERLSQAASDFQGISLYESDARLAEDDLVDLVIVATPPDLHAAHCQQMMRAGKHVLCEKPLALSSQETRSMISTAKEYGVHLSCHQNRRWDTDYLAIRQCVESGRIGELFHLETFVGGFHHPCGYWHSHRAVSGGTSFDWGAHYLDWIVSLLPIPIEAVMGSRHKRVWHDVTNGDQERIQIRFADGQEADFIHSDIAAVRKPKWYLLGTKGAILGDWQDITAYHSDPVYYFQKDDIPATEMMPEIKVLLRHASGDLEEIRPTLPERQPYAFHANLADHLLWGEPLAAPLSDSAKVVAVLEAAARSMDNNSRWERPEYE